MVGTQGLVVSERVSPEDQPCPIDSTSPPRRANASWHLTNEAKNLASVSDGLLHIRQALLVHPQHLLIRAVHTLPSGEALNLWEI